MSKRKQIPTEELREPEYYIAEIERLDRESRKLMKQISKNLKAWRTEGSDERRIAEVPESLFD